MRARKGSKAKEANATSVSKAVEAPETVEKTDAGFSIVGIGASAGGLAAFEAFFSGMPADTDPGMAFVLVQHLAPDHKSILSDLVKRYTRIQVFEVEDGIKVQPNCAYIIPPNRDMAFLSGTLQLLEPSAPRGQRLPIDFFFRSLAQDQHERAICVVLSGTGSDGTLGVRAIKGEGGMVMAQTPESTEHDGMPRSAIATGLVDYALPPAEMPAQLIAYAAHAFGKAPRPVSLPAAKADDISLKKIFVLLCAQTGHYFSHYKQSTIHRRIERRRAVHQIEQLDGYVRYLQQTPEELETLFRDLLIGVTSFFRDPEAFAALEAQVIPRLFDGKPAGALIRVWAPGCSTGEEAYSIAMLLQERIEELKQSFKAQVFATDIDSRAIDAARAGVYPASIAADVTPERLARFFTQEPGGGAYRINKSIRDLLVFSEQDVIKDPPFSKLDLISCRNLMIYMGGELQKKLIPLFHYSLNSGGFLFLGTSESVGDFSSLFAPLDRKLKLYQRKEDVRGASLPRMGKVLPPLMEEGAVSRRSGKAHGESKLPLRELTERALLQQYAPAGALINECGDILYLHGRTGLYLEPAPGEAGLNILKMAREGLRRNLTMALHRKEELQSVNEELATVNAELQQKVADLSRANNDMNNLLAGTGIGAIFVDHQLRIQRFTPAVTEVINLIPTDVRRPVSHIASNLTGYNRLVEDVKAVLDTLTPKEVEVRTRAGAWYLLRIRPYRTLENVIEGAVIAFFDITEMKRVQQALRESESLRRLAVVVRDARDAITVQDLEGRILAWNPAAERMYGWSEAEALAMNIRDLIPEELRKEAHAMTRQLGRAEALAPYRTQRLAKDGRIVNVQLTTTALVNEAGQAYAIATTERAKGTTNEHE
ncbi:MAG: PAS domain-containing protein [Candidatus Sumerlaeota bacterium]|nr:PAS domain-containing protein [Candidatus Sumerlaeota bacterium]